MPTNPGFSITQWMWWALLKKCPIGSVIFPDNAHPTKAITLAGGVGVLPKAAEVCLQSRHGHLC